MDLILVEDDYQFAAFACYRYVNVPNAHIAAQAWV
jgi:hypothetical protein